MKTLFCYPALLLALAGCALPQDSAPAKPGLTAWDAITLSEQSAPSPIPGVFSLQIRNADRVGNLVYLNTESDYRDRRNVTVVLTPHVLKEFAEQYPDQPPEYYFLGRSIVVNGSASRQTIWFTSNGKKTEKYYFQTHIPVWYAGQILSPLTTQAYWKQNKKAEEHQLPPQTTEHIKTLN